MSKEIKQILILNAIVGVMFNFINIFVNLYIWEKNKEVFDMAWFSLFQFSFWAFSYVIGIKIFIEKDYSFLMKLSAITSLTTFFMLAFLDFKNELLGVAIIGSIVGCTNGIYYSGLTQILAIHIKGKEYDQFFSVRAVINQIITTLVPLFFAVMIIQFGYKSTFVCMFLVSLFMYLYTYRLPKISLNNENPKEIHAFDDFSYKKVFVDTKLKLMSASFILGGFYLQFQVVFLTIFTFTITDNKFYIGLLNVVYSLLTVLFLFIYQKTRQKMNVIHWLWIGIGFVFIGFMIAIVSGSYLLILANCFIIVGNFFFQTNYQSEHYQAVSQYPLSIKTKYIIWREILLCSSRSVLLLFALFVKDIHDIYFVFLFIAAIVSAISIPFIHQKSKE